MTDRDHDHVGFMEFTDRSATCTRCNRSWWMQRYTDKMGKVRCFWQPKGALSGRT